jgi:hypothetical protein
MRQLVSRMEARKDDRLQEATPANEMASANPDHSRHAAVIAPGTIRLPIHFFVFCVVCFASGSAALPWVAPRAVRFFYQPAVLSLVHLFALGFVTPTIMGVMYRYVPALTHRRVAFPRLGALQFGCYVVGVAGMVAHFAIGEWSGLWWAAALVLVSVILFAINLFPPLWSRVGRAAVETGMFAAICFLLLAAALGVLMGLEETYGFRWGNLVTHLGAHVTFAAIGWVTLTICAASFRFVSAFVLPRRSLMRFARWQILALAFGTIGLGVSLLLDRAAAGAWSAVVVAALLGYIVIMAGVVHSRRVAIDWDVAHALAGLLWLSAAVVLGGVVAWCGAWSATGAPFAGALGVAALLGWAGNFIIGMSYRLFPGFVVGVRAALQYPRRGVTHLSVKSRRPLIFLVFNGGVLALGAAFIIGASRLAAFGGWLVLFAVLPYTVVTCRTLSYAYRRAVRIATQTDLQEMSG